MANARGKSIDNTHLSIDQAETRGFIHRDYIAHCLRWTHVVKHLYKQGNYREARVFDIGCGVDIPLAKTLYSQRLIVDHYIGVDYNVVGKFDLTPFHSGKFPVTALGGVDFCDDDRVGLFPGPDGPLLRLTDTWTIHGNEEVRDAALPNIFTCFEVVEHIEPEHVRRLLSKVRELMLAANETSAIPVRLFLSTPNYDEQVGAAKNHVNEMKHNALGFLLESLGFEVVANYGTFASQTHYRDQFLADYSEGAKLWEQLSAYYDSNYLATILAPLYPHLARNCLWELRAVEEGEERDTRYLHADLAALAPWTSSENWGELLPEMAAAF